MTNDADRYAGRGVSANKKDVHDAIKGLDKGIYPTAFCKILPDIAAGDPDFCNIMHADTAGTKTGLAYLYWKETGDLSVWKNIVQDAVVMNLDDMGCVGATDQVILSSTIGRNKQLVGGDVLKTLIQSAADFAEGLKKFDIHIYLAGGETADVGDIVRTIDVGFTAFSRMRRQDLIVNDIQAGDVIVGFSSSGQATYESEYNSGMGCNGLTSARHDVLDHSYAAKYPESFERLTPEYLVYSGKKRLTDPMMAGGAESTVGRLLLSPTRTYLPLLKKAIQFFRPQITGIIHCTGGGQTKALKFVRQKHIVKDNLFSPPEVFQLIQRESGTGYKEMYQVFNMGCRMEIYCKKAVADELIALSKSFNIDAQITGRVEASADGEKMTIESPYGVFQYS